MILVLDILQFVVRIFSYDVNGTPNQPSILPELCPPGDYYCGGIRDMKQPKRVKSTNHGVSLDENKWYRTSIRPEYK